MGQRSQAVMMTVAGSAWCAVLIALGAPAAAVPSAAPSGGTWSPAIEVPGTGALNSGGDAVVNSVSCGSAGNCAAGGVYSDAGHRGQAFVVTQVNGVWGKAREVPGLATLNTGGIAAVTSVSCVSAGNCAAGGNYSDSSGRSHVFVINEVKGTWHNARQVPGAAALNAGGRANIRSVSCGSAGNCSAGCWYTDGAGHGQAFVVSEVSNTWRAAREVGGTAALNAGGDAGTASVSCGSPGNCSAGGSYTDRAGKIQAFVVSKVNGTWHAAREVPGSASLNAGGKAAAASVSCATAGNCAAGGSYTDSAGHLQAFVVNQAGGTWGTAHEVPGSASLNANGDAEAFSVSCPSAGNCTAGGFLASGSAYLHAFVATEASGTWKSARAVPGLALMDQSGGSSVSSLSCGSPGNCAVVGTYIDSAWHMQAFVASEVNGTWRTAKEIPGLGRLNTGAQAAVNTVSCPAPSRCAAGGYFLGETGFQAFLASER